MRVQVKGATVDILATTVDDAAIDTKEEVLIVELDGTTARVARMSEGGSKQTGRGV